MDTRQSTSAQLDAATGRQAHRSAQGKWLLVLVLVLLLVPYLSKPPHIDEESYLFIGHALQAHGSRPYHWWRAWQPTWAPAEHSYLYAHPPLFLWWSALTEWLCGQNVLLRRLCALPWVLGLAVGTMGLCRRFLTPRSLALQPKGNSSLDAERSSPLQSARPGVVAGVLLTAPCLLLIQHQSLMPDLPWLSLIVLACWRGTTAPVARSWRSWPHLQAGLLLGLAGWTKYPALVLIPLGGLLPGATLGMASSWMLGVLLVVVPGECYLWATYGTPHLWAVLRSSPQIEHTSSLARAFGMLSQLGLCSLGPVLLLRFWGRDAARARRAALAAMLLGAAGWAGMRWAVAQEGRGLSADGPGGLLQSLAQLEPSFPPLAGPWDGGLWGVQLMLAFALGGALLSSLRLRTPEERFLSGWALLVLGAVLWGHNFSSTRYLGPAVVPLGLLAARQAGSLRRAGRVMVLLLAALGLGLSCWIAEADLRLAQAYPQLAEALESRIAPLRAPGSTVWFRGEWGFRAELEARGYQTLPPGRRAAPGDVLVWADLAGAGRFLPELRLEHEGRLEAPASGLRVMAPGLAGFYSSVLGLLPYTWAPGALERVGYGCVGAGRLGEGHILEGRAGEGRAGEDRMPGLPESAQGTAGEVAPR